jgi:hypothetical protein
MSNMQKSAATNHLLQNQNSLKCNFLETVIFTTSNQELIVEYVDLLKNPEYQSKITANLSIIVNSIDLSKIN